MEQILFIREAVVKFIKRYERIILFAGKFLLAFIILSYINRIGLVRDEFVKYTMPPYSFLYTMFFCFVFAVASVPTGYMLIILLITLQLSGFIEIAAIVFIFLIMIMLFYVRLAPKQSALILAMLLAYQLGVPYVVPIFAGMYIGITAIIPISIAVFIWWNFMPLIQTLLTSIKTAGLDVMAMANTFVEIYNNVFINVTRDSNWIFSAFVFAMVVVLVYGVCSISMDYAKELAIALGGIMNVISFIMVVIITDLNISLLSVFFFTVIAVVAMYAVRFLDCVLDYQKAERVQFEDEDNYYYVKVIPKISLTKKKRVVKRIRPNEE